MSSRGIVVVAGGGGFIGGHLVARLLADGYHVSSVDIKPLDEWFQVHTGAENRVADLSSLAEARAAVAGADVVYNLAADMGGIGFIENFKAQCMLSVLINTHLLLASRAAGIQRYFYASSACIYPAGRQDSPEVVPLAEQMAYPAMPEDGYGWEKLFSERMCRHFTEDFALPTRVARFHNVYGPHGTWRGGREKAPAAICRKVAEAILLDNSTIDIWGDGLQTRSFMYIEDCVEGIVRIMNSDIDEPLNLGSSELVTIRQLVDIVSGIAGLQPNCRYQLDAPQGVRGRNSDNTLIRARLGWEPTTSLVDGLAETYAWVYKEVSDAYAARVGQCA
ncbi:NAD-dependent epimerase/dehydratase family protein [Nocardia sp. NBC_01730]|uniref:NAD-dependent epimerase/dehydratase family protein n=1 Tax=Nocardia sp. NBC_01730 TaxID=2975998 RepID=UPI002E1650E1|nr:NAD-dependent epimerase/dehydratase family protein [Nocardia sp. NBC_01730]